MAEQAKKQTKMHSPLKRELQNKKKHLRRRSFRARVQTAVRKLRTALTAKEAEANLGEQLNGIYSLMDKGVKKGIYTPNKAARSKSRLSALVRQA